MAQYRRLTTGGTGFPLISGVNLQPDLLLVDGEGVRLPSRQHQPWPGMGPVVGARARSDDDVPRALLLGQEEVRNGSGVAHG